MKQSVFVLAIAILTVVAITILSKETPVQAQPTALDNAPVGSIVAWPGQSNTIPSGWVECDGRMLNKNTYDALARAIGTTWGGVGTADIKIPDLRGYFLRGVSGTTNNDPNKNNRMVPAGGASNGPGSTQQSGLKNHKHRMASEHFLEAEGGTGFNGAGYTANSANHSVGPFYTKEDGGGDETRPLNAYIYWIIRVK